MIIIDKEFIKKLVTRKYSKQRFARYLPTTMVDGEGFRCSLYVSGCMFACKGCYNKSIQDFNNGTDYNEKIHKQILKDLERDEINGLTLLGGEPFMNTEICLPLVKDVKNKFNETKTIWSWTGYTWEELMYSISLETEISKQQRDMLNCIDVLVDGRYQHDKRSLTTPFRGSTNQTIIDVQESLRQNKKILVEKYK